MTKSTLALVVLSSMAFAVDGFSTAGLPKTSRSSLTVSYAYIPAGFTAETWKQFQKKEQEKKQRNLGQLGPRGFESRSMQSFQEAMERGEASHLMPMFNAKEKLAKGKIRQEDIPYMQRGGRWDQSDVKGAKKKRWLASDKQYKSGGYKKEQSVSIFGKGAGLDWTGKAQKKGPESVIGAAPKFAKNYKPLNVNDLSGSDKKPKKKGFFGF